MFRTPHLRLPALLVVCLLVATIIVTVMGVPSHAMAQTIVTAALPATSNSIVTYLAETALTVFLGIASIAVGALARRFGIEVETKRLNEARDVIRSGLMHAADYARATAVRDGIDPDKASNWGEVAARGAAYASQQFPDALRTVGLEPERLADMVLARLSTASVPGIGTFDR
jgi:hypothetical protein